MLSAWGFELEDGTGYRIEAGPVQTHADSEYRQAGTHAAPVEAGLFEQATVQFLRALAAPSSLDVHDHFDEGRDGGCGVRWQHCTSAEGGFKGGQGGCGVR